VTERRIAIKALCGVPNVGPAIAQDLLRLGIRRVENLAGANPDELYQELCRLEGRRVDICVRDVFAAAVDYADGKTEQALVGVLARPQGTGNAPAGLKAGLLR
jgi:predicted flap endonuclease-1-like 5' DNA nuclease